MIENITRYFEGGWMIHRKAVTQDAAGGITETFSTHAAVEGRMRPLSGNKIVSADKATYFADFRFYCFPADILEGDRLVKGSDTYDVKHAADMMDFGRLMQVDCELVR